MTILKNLRILALCLSVSFLWSSCGDDAVLPPAVKLVQDYDNEVVLKWHQLFLDIDRFAPGYRPPISSRALAYINLAAYEAAVPGMPNNNSIGKTYPGLSLPNIESGKEYHWPSAINAAYGEMFRSMMPHVVQNDLFRMAELETRFMDKYSDEVSNEVFNRSADFGKKVAQAVYAWETTDAAGHEAYLNPQPASYVPPASNADYPYLWNPTGQKGLCPYWKNVRSFALKPQDLSGGVPPLPYSESPTSPMYLQAYEVYNTTNAARNNPASDAYWVAWFWADDIYKFTFEPAARQIAIANQLITKENSDLATAVELYTKLSMSMCDGAIVTWAEKYIYNIERPVAYIQRLIDPTWKPLLNDPVNGVNGVTPPFPAYPSGHSTFGPTAAAIFASFFGNNYEFTDHCHVDRTDFKGTPRTYQYFHQMGIENAISRIPLGVHFRMDCEEGIRIGDLTANRVLNLPWKK